MKPDTLPHVVLDSFALIAFLQGEAGGERITAWLEKARAGSVHLFLSIINLGQVVYILERDVGLEKTVETLGVIDELPLTIVQVNRRRVLAAAHLKAQYAISYADAFAVALAHELNAWLVSGDPELKQVESLISIDWITR